MSKHSHVRETIISALARIPATLLADSEVYAKYRTKEGLVKYWNEELPDASYDDPNVRVISIGLDLFADIPGRAPILVINRALGLLYDFNPKDLMDMAILSPSGLKSLPAPKLVNVTFPFLTLEASTNVLKHVGDDDSLKRYLKIQGVSRAIRHAMSRGSFFPKEDHGIFNECYLMGE